jgi:hypothetical protein
MAAAADPEIDTRKRMSSGNVFWDANCKIMHSDIAKEAGVLPGFCFYDDSDGANALALPDALFPQEPDGTIMFGVTLLDREMPPAATDPFQPVIAVLMAHEFGHILQYRSGMSPDGPWQMEPHADFLGGFLLGKIMKKRNTSVLPGFGFSSMSVLRAVQVLFRYGDTLFNSPLHHGEPEFRAAMV